MTATIATISEQIQSGLLEKARHGLASLEKAGDPSAETAFLRGSLEQACYNREPALEAFEQVLAQSPEHKEATFRAALLADQCGDDERAIELYEQCTIGNHAHVHALINLSILYEDNGMLEDAELCLDQVLDEFPEHFRASHYLKSVESSFTMAYDERTQRERDQRNAILDMPVTDFELSVRSRNCLRQMNIRTVGDLLDTSEAELLAYKNFGETSLNEIKALLAQKSLRLGQGTHTVLSPAPPIAPLPRLTGDAALVAQRSVNELELSVRSRKCLQRLGITTLGELTLRSENELMSIKNFGQTSLNEIKRQLTRLGLSLRKSG